MFTRKKKFYQRKLFYVAVVLLLAVGYWVSPLANQQDTGLEANENAKPTIEQQTGGTKSGTGLSDAKNPEGDRQNVAYAGEENPEEGTASGSEYYLVKEIDGIIKIFHYDTHGNEDQARSTNISFSLLSESDQQMFAEGVLLYGEDELTNLLQDFES